MTRMAMHPGCGQKTTDRVANTVTEKMDKMSKIKFGNRTIARETLPGDRCRSKRSLSTVLTALSLFAPAALASNGDMSSASSIALFLIIILGLGGLIIGALVLWGKKQDEINNMMFFCIKYFINSTDTHEKCSAARALGRAKDPAALLLLVDVVNDENVEDGVHKCAADALGQMRRNYRNYRSVIDELLNAVEARDKKKIIDIVVANFEQGEERYLQSAYLIGNEYMALGQYGEAREWFFKARFRNNRESIYQEQIEEAIDQCNNQLFIEGDQLFKEGEYHAAKEHYTLAATRLGEEGQRRFAAHLRLACVYCKIGDYVDADQSLLQALRHHHDTDTSLRLIKFLQDVLNKNQRLQTDDTSAKRKIDERVTEVMARVTATHSTG